MTNEEFSIRTIFFLGGILIGIALSWAADKVDTYLNTRFIDRYIAETKKKNG